jgi:hypothetical protein
MLPQVIKPATDIFQQHMGALFFDMPVVVVYMDDIIVFDYLDFGMHLVNVMEVLNSKCSIERRVSKAANQIQGRNQRGHKNICIGQHSRHLRTRLAACLYPTVVSYHPTTPRNQTHAGHLERKFLLARRGCSS